MQVEIEAKFLNIDKKKLRKLLKDSGATLIHSEYLMRRRNFDYLDGGLQKKGGWVRVRDEGDKVTLAYKQLIDRTIEGTQEISLIVEDFDKISDLLLAVGFNNKSYQETKRERWELDGVEVTIDTWPWIPSFVELEGKNEKMLKLVASKLLLEWGKSLHGSVETAYQEYYSVSEADVNKWETMTFTSVPKWLEERRK